MLQLRPFQKEALNVLTSSKSNHLVVVAPTGSGKSLIYERVAALPDRRTLLVTPLIALAHQQSEKLRSLGISVKLGLGVSEDKTSPNGTGAWIVSPEFLQAPSRRSYLHRWRPNFLVVDECHCLWEWGEKFRPSFGRVPHLIGEHEIQQSVWLTATLPKDARASLQASLPSPVIEIGDFDLPPNIYLSVQKVAWEHRAQALIACVRRMKGHGIIFVPTREATQRVARLVQGVGKKVVTYHAGMSAEERRNTEQGVKQKIPEVIVATSAFGMGMDYPHLNYVILWQAPTSILSLVQTIGRVGRDRNEKGFAWVLWDREDFRLLEWTIQNSERRRNDLLQLMNFFSERDCRRVLLKRYFGFEGLSSRCGQCDACSLEQGL